MFNTPGLIELAIEVDTGDARRMLDQFSCLPTPHNADTSGFSRVG